MPATRAAPSASRRSSARPSTCLSTAPRASYDFFNGSSFAAAHVAGVAALLLERKPSLTAAEVRELLMARGGRDDGETPRIDPCAALAKLEGRAVCAAP